MAHLIDTMAYTGQTPWHGLGNVLPPQQSLDIWLQAAGMNWTIEQSDVMFNSPPYRWSQVATTWYSLTRCCTSIKIW